MMNLKQVEKLERDYVKSIGGWYELGENQTFSNKVSRAKVRAFKRQHGRAYLGNINFYENTPPNYAEYRKGMIRNFEYHFVVPYPDTYLAMLIDQRNAIPYTGTAQDIKLIDPIFERLYEIGGVALHWV